MDIIPALKRKVCKKVHRFVKHKATLTAFDIYINQLGNRESLTMIIEVCVLYFRS